MAASMDELAVGGKRVLVRCDLNVPMANGKVTDATRIERLAPTVKELADAGARVVLMSHFGRPKGKREPSMSLGPVVKPLAESLGGRHVLFVEDCVGQAAESAVASLKDGEIALLENLRFHEGEEANSPEFAAALARLGDVYVNDAFAAAHRAHASTEAIARLLPSAPGRLMEAEISALTNVLEKPTRPVAAIIGGAKVSTKLDLLGNLLTKVDVLAIGGAMANTFLHARGLSVGASLMERDLAETARGILAKADSADCQILLPEDVVVAPRLELNVPSEVIAASAVPDDRMILDIGRDAAQDLVQRLTDIRTLLWNGPLGAFEVPPFDAGTVVVARAVAERTRSGRLMSVAGGGDTVAALSAAGVLEDFTYVSTAGGAFLEWLEG
ncbi:MAG: phosphoglycerate kinase, partial [Alphaproteobacteria bacterium]